LTVSDEVEVEEVVLFIEFVIAFFISLNFSV
jgi:hypothetical protein